MEVTNNDSVVKQLRLVLGVYPDEFEEVHNVIAGTEIMPTNLPESIKKECGKSWIDQRIKQITYIFREIKMGYKFELAGPILTIT